MSDNDKSAAEPTSAPGFGAFGSARGSGLARGKRPAQPAPSTAAASPAGYKPTALEVIRPASEYKNPFTGETSVPSAPPRPEPVERAVSEPAPQAVPSVTTEHRHIDPIVEAEKPAAPPAPAAAESRPAPAASAADAPLFPFEGSEKAELKILPPENAKRPAVSWEAPGAKPAAGQPDEAPPRRDERPAFRPERRDGRGESRGESRDPRPFEPRQPRDPRDQRQPRDPREERQPRDPRDERQPRDPREERQPRDPRDERKFEPRPNQPYRERAPQPEPAKKPGGFLGWLKSLFGGGDQPAAPATGSGQRDSEPRHEGDREQGGQRRHRGGRGRGQGGGGQGGGYRDENRGPRPEGQPGGDGRSYGGEGRGDGRGEGDGGGRRRRRRGGRGRFRGEGGGEGRGPRPEGQQGGGAI